jgi:hypothetical protein
LVANTDVLATCESYINAAGVSAASNLFSMSSAIGASNQGATVTTSTADFTTDIDIVVTGQNASAQTSTIQSIRVEFIGGDFTA